MRETERVATRRHAATGKEFQYGKRSRPGFTPSSSGFNFVNSFPAGIPVTAIPIPGTGITIPIWDSGTWGYPGSRLVVLDDGNVVIYRADGPAIWATNTVQP